MLVHFSFVLGADALLLHFGGAADEILEEVGKGTFGKVFRCKDSKYNDQVAVKMVRSVKRYVSSAKIEAAILDKIFDKQQERHTALCVKMYSHFHIQGCRRT